MDDKLRIPTDDDLATLSRDALKHERMRLRTELAFARSDVANGGPPRTALVTALKAALTKIEQRLNP